MFNTSHRTPSYTPFYSGKSLTADGTAKLRNQVIDAPWVTPGHFTQAPSLDCIFSQCYSIKSWLDLRSDHVAIVHCSNGRSRSGILIACLLKYIGAFDHASQAFDFFCSARCQQSYLNWILKFDSFDFEERMRRDNLHILSPPILLYSTSCPACHPAHGVLMILNFPHCIALLELQSCPRHIWNFSFIPSTLPYIYPSIYLPISLPVPVYP